MTSHPAIAARLSQWREDRAAYGLHLENAYQQAVAATNGNLLNARGKALGIDSWTLFSGPGAHMRRRAYASDELREHLAAHPVVTFQDWEAQHGRTPGRQWGLLLEEWAAGVDAIAAGDVVWSERDGWVLT